VDIACWPFSDLAFVLRASGPNALGAHIGYLPQDAELFEGSIAENISRVPHAPDASVIAAAKAAGVHDLIVNLPSGYNTPISEQGAMLSAGWQLFGTWAPSDLSPQIADKLALSGLADRFRPYQRASFLAYEIPCYSTEVPCSLKYFPC
jgi:hypothetical protein